MHCIRFQATTKRNHPTHVRVKRNGSKINHEFCGLKAQNKDKLFAQLITLAEPKNILLVFSSESMAVSPFESCLTNKTIWENDRPPR